MKDKHLAQLAQNTKDALRSIARLLINNDLPQNVERTLIFIAYQLTNNARAEDAITSLCLVQRFLTTDIPVNDNPKTELPWHIQKLLDRIVPFLGEEVKGYYGKRALHEAFQPTVDLVARAFPEGLSEEDYLPLLVLFSSHFTIGNLEELADHWSNGTREPPNDALWAGMEPPPVSAAAVEAILRKLEAVGYSQWLDGKHGDI